MAKKKDNCRHQQEVRKLSERDFCRDFVFEDVKEHNAPIIAQIKETQNKYLHHLLSIHNPLFYIYRGTERLNSGETEDLYYFTYFNGVMVYTFVENVNPGKATFVIQTAITQSSNGSNYNYLLSQIKSYFSSDIVNKRSKLFTFELRPFSGFHLGYDRISHIDIEQWKKLLESKYHLLKPNKIDIHPAKAPVCLPTFTIKTHEQIKAAKLEKKSIRYIRVGNPQLLVKDKIVLLSHEINSNVAFRISSFIRANGGKIAASNRSRYDFVIVSAKELLEKPGSILYEIAQKVRLCCIPVAIASDFLRSIK